MANQVSIGQRAVRLDGVAKVTGAAVYAGDIRLPGMLHAKVLRSPYAHARIRHIDTVRARELKEVVAVITPADVPRIPINPAGHPYPDSPPIDYYILDWESRYVGDPVAAVAAESEEAAVAALRAIQVDYEVLPAVFDEVEALKPGAPLVHEDGNLAALTGFSHGDVERGFREADLVVEEEYRTQIVQHCPLEPHACVCALDPSGRLVVWSSTQIPFTLRRLLAQALDLPYGVVRVIKCEVGGGFGSKQDLVQESICAALAMKARRPVRLVYSREEDIGATRTRHAAVFRLKSGVSKDGCLLSRELQVITNTGAYASHGPSVTAYMGGMWAPLYRSPNLRFEGKTVYTNLPVAGAMRAYGVPQVCYALESHMDEIARRLGLDPIEFRCRNLVRAGDVDPVSGRIIQTCGLEECLRKGASAIGWNQPRASTGSLRRGLGVACFAYASGTGPEGKEIAAARVRLNEDGSVTLFLGTGEIGQGTDTALAQIVAEELGIPLSAVSLAPVDTDVSPFDLGSYASRQTFVTGSAVRKAARELRELVLLVAARLLDCTPESLRQQHGVIWRSDGGGRLSLRDIGLESYYGSCQGTLEVEAHHVPTSNPLAFGAQFAEVEVDLETGKVRVLRLVAAHDVGCALNPTLVEGQIDGGAAMGIGYALTEQLVYDPKNGTVLSTNFLDYKIPTSNDIPDVESILVETFDPEGPYGAKAVGEPPTIPTAPAISNAFFAATGARLRSLPLTPEKVWRAVGQ